MLGSVAPTMTFMLGSEPKHDGDPKLKLATLHKIVGIEMPTIETFYASICYYFTNCLLHVLKLQDLMQVSPVYIIAIIIPAVQPLVFQSQHSFTAGSTGGSSI